jgi:hypothetical protein
MVCRLAGYSSYVKQSSHHKAAEKIGKRNHEATAPPNHEANRGKVILRKQLALDRRQPQESLSGTYIYFLSWSLDYFFLNALSS